MILRMRNAVPRIFLCMCLSLLLLAAAACSTVGHSIAGIDNFDQVSPALFRGAQPNAAGFQTLAARHIRSVINLRDDPDPAEAAEARAAGLRYCALPWNAMQVTPADAERFLTLLASAPSPVFVHCLAGRDRTGLAVAAYRLRVQHWTLPATLADLDGHGYNWLLFPNIRRAVTALPATAPDASVVSPG